MRRSEESGEIIFDFGFTDNLKKVSTKEDKTRQYKTSQNDNKTNLTWVITNSSHLVYDTFSFFTG